MSWALAAALVISALGLPTGGAAGVPSSGTAVGIATGQATVMASKPRPRATLTYQATMDARGRLVVTLRSPAKKVTVTYKVPYKKGTRTRSKKATFRQGAALVIVPAGATKVRAKTKATRTLRASRKIVVRLTPIVTPVPPTPPPTTPRRPLPRRHPSRPRLPASSRSGCPRSVPPSPDTPPPTRWYEAMQTLDCDLDRGHDPAGHHAAGAAGDVRLPGAALPDPDRGRAGRWTGRPPRRPCSRPRASRTATSSPCGRC